MGQCRGKVRGPAGSGGVQVRFCARFQAMQAQIIIGLLLGNPSNKVSASGNLFSSEYGLEGFRSVDCNRGWRKGVVKKRQEVSNVSFHILHQFSSRAKSVKHQGRNFFFFDNCRKAPILWPLLRGSDQSIVRAQLCCLVC